MKCFMRSTGAGLIPCEVSFEDFCDYVKLGEEYVVEIKKVRNYKFHKKFFALLNECFKCWEVPRLYDVNNPPPIKDFDAFREKVIIRAGRYDAVFDLDGNFEMKAKSISFAKMDEIEFEKLYNDCIQVLLDILPRHTKQDIDSMVDKVLGFV